MPRVHGSAHAAAALIALLFTASSAEAQEPPSLALNRYNPSFAGDHFFGVASPFAAGHLDVHGIVVGDYANNPLVLERMTGGEETEVGAIVAHQLFLHLNATFSVFDRAALNLDAPVALFQKGDDPAVGTNSFASPSGAQFGDLRIGLRGRLFGEYRDGLQIGAGGYLWVPTGPDDSGDYVSDGGVRGMPEVLLGGQIDWFVYATELGVDIREQREVLGIGQGTRFVWGAAAGMLLGSEDQFQIGGEGYGTVVLDDVRGRSTNVELLFGGKWRFLDHFVAGGAAGPGLAPGVGTPDVRALLSLAFSPKQDMPKAEEVERVAKKPAPPTPVPLADKDRDGIADDLDACPELAGVASEDHTKNGCPADGDGDGITDAEDACPAVAGVPNDDRARHGCPPDRDGDGIADAEDACPEVSGVRSEDRARHGCPPDRDGDSVLDGVDACVDAPGLPNADPKKNGCPKVLVTATQIQIFERIEFATGRATIDPQSKDIIDQVATVLREHPDITRIEVQGHTDNKGTAGLNKLLSGQRAEAVVKALVARGIDKKRLVSKGYGQEKPIAPNDTEQGRQDNRRVQFDILERAPQSK